MHNVYVHIKPIIDNNSHVVPYRQESAEVLHMCLYQRRQDFCACIATLGSQTSFTTRSHTHKHTHTRNWFTFCTVTFPWTSLLFKITAPVSTSSLEIMLLCVRPRFRFKFWHQNTIPTETTSKQQPRFVVVFLRHVKNRPNISPPGSSTFAICSAYDRFLAK